MAMTLDPQRTLLALGCRVAAARGLADGILGHLSLRIDDDRLLIRCRSDTDTGMAFTMPNDIRLVRLDGTAGAAGELDGYRVPNELPIHVETMLANPAYRAVAHLHLRRSSPRIWPTSRCGRSTAPTTFPARGSRAAACPSTKAPS
ncbi:hypothetical protein NIIDMKKI_45490 [Mycobacterium kansasii]|uniref:Class II aldolase/adducin N-terminal domain-containing protein n=1 Tax=Mycobacterium kansasii TaxID=1768 RepID=A0A7G1IGP8_MYCKA|nr:hypothetical protein NIIDMKKI_45490 [Mycobacterium kansasii]